MDAEDELSALPEVEPDALPLVSELLDGELLPEPDMLPEALPEVEESAGALLELDDELVSGAGMVVEDELLDEGGVTTVVSRSVCAVVVGGLVEEVVVASPPSQPAMVMEPKAMMATAGMIFLMTSPLSENASPRTRTSRATGRGGGRPPELAASRNILRDWAESFS